jgi:hypothetical protein
VKMSPFSYRSMVTESAGAAASNPVDISECFPWIKWHKFEGDKSPGCSAVVQKP